MGFITQTTDTQAVAACSWEYQLLVDDEDKQTKIRHQETHARNKYRFLVMVAMTLIVVINDHFYRPFNLLPSRRRVIHVHSEEEFHQVTQGRAIVLLGDTNYDLVADWNNFVKQNAWRFDGDIKFVAFVHEGGGHPTMRLYEQGTPDYIFGYNIRHQLSDHEKLWQDLHNELQRRITLTSRTFTPRFIQPLVSENDLRQFLKGNQQGAMVMYHVEWCDYCRKMAEFLSRFRTQAYQKKHPVVPIADLDCSKLQLGPIRDENKYAAKLIAQACDRKRTGRRPFPLVRFYRDDTATGDYKGNAFYDGYMADFIREQMN